MQLKGGTNLLPFDGLAVYASGFIKDAEGFQGYLMQSVPWQQDQVRMYGKLITTRRKVAWFGDEGAVYKYAGIARAPLSWLPELNELRNKVGATCGTAFNSCLANLYHSGSEGMGWHRDNEPDLVKHGVIASLSLGAARRFDFRHRKTRTKISVMLEPGSLLVMAGEVQDHWEHQLPVAKKVLEPRINLTFRTIRAER